MKDYTVVGMYADNSQVIVEWLEADGPSSATEKLSRKMDRVGGGSVLAVFEGHHIDRREI